MSCGRRQVNSRIPHERVELEAALVDQRQESHARDVDRQHETGVSCGNLVAHEPIFDVSSDGLER